MISIDTNILARYLLNDTPPKRLLRRSCLSVNRSRSYGVS
jgi:predicted nucleic-acid-binding protein